MPATRRFSARSAARRPAAPGAAGRPLSARLAAARLAAARLVTTRLAAARLAATLLAATGLPAALPAAGPAMAAPSYTLAPLGLYQARTLVTGTDMRSRPAGFAQCLRDVLVKVSGDPRLAGDPRVAALTADAGRFVAGFDYLDRMSGISRHDDQGSSDRPYFLTVSFDAARIDALLKDLGAAPWRGPRPVLAPVVFMNGLKTRYLLSAALPQADAPRAALADAGERFAMPLALPDPDALGRPLPADRVALPGLLTYSETDPGWVATWQFGWQGAGYTWTVRGVSFDEAFRSGVKGAMQIVSGHGAPR